MSPLCCTFTWVLATSATSRSVPVMLRLLSRAAGSALASTGLV
jgi:hypothetical protein